MTASEVAYEHNSYDIVRSLSPQAAKQTLESMLACRRV
jgi:hypothetical protein